MLSFAHLCDLLPSESPIPEKIKKFFWNACRVLESKCDLVVLVFLLLGDAHLRELDQIG